MIGISNADPDVIRILELDGGGMRGCYSMAGLAKICADFSLPANSLNNVFDIICGTSIGGLTTLGLCFGNTPSGLQTIIETNGPLIFDASLVPWIGEPKAGIADVVEYVTGVTSSMYYNTKLISTVASVVGTKKISDITGCKVIIPTVKYNSVVSKGNVFPKAAEIVLLSNSTIDGFSGQDWLASDAAMATSAAPMYFPSWSVGGDTYIDGGLAQNNMSIGALLLGRIMKKKAKKICVLSIGTGIGDMGFARSSPTLNSNNLGLFEGASTLTDCISMGISLPQEVNAFYLSLFSYWDDFQFYSYRFNTEFDPAVDAELDSASDVAIQYFRSSASATYKRDADEINTFMSHFL